MCLTQTSQLRISQDIMYTCVSALLMRSCHDVNCVRRYSHRSAISRNRRDHPSRSCVMRHVVVYTSRPTNLQAQAPLEKRSGHDIMIHANDRGLSNLKGLLPSSPHATYMLLLVHPRAVLIWSGLDLRDSLQLRAMLSSCCAMSLPSLWMHGAAA